MPHDADRHGRQFANREFEHAKVVGALPGAGAGASIVLADTVRKVQEHAEYMLDHGLRAIGADIAHGDAVFFSGLEIDVVDAGCRQPDEPQASGGGNYLLRHADLVNENEVRIVDSLAEVAPAAATALRMSGTS